MIEKTRFAVDPKLFAIFEYFKKIFFFAVDLILLLKIKGACVHPGGCLNMVFVILGVGCLVSRAHQFVSRVG